VQSQVKQTENQASKTTQTNGTFFGGSGGASFFQAKLTVNQPGDKYEQEADAVAEKVVNKIGTGTGAESIQPAPPTISRVQRKTEESEEKEESVQRMELPEKEQEVPVQRMTERPEEAVQKKEAEDKEDEQPSQRKEEGQEPVQRMGLDDKKEEAPVQRMAEGPEEAVQKKETEVKEDEQPLQRKEMEEEPVQRMRLDEKKEEAPVQRMAEQPKEEEVQAKSNGTPAAPSASFTHQLNSSKGSGSLLSESTRSLMESGIGADFSKVRVHTDNHASSMSRDINAKAFTHESDVYFNSGQYNPGTLSGQQLLAHELTHTVQQGASERIQPKQTEEKDEAPLLQSKDETAPDIQAKEDGIRPELKKAVLLAKQEQGKVNAGVKNEDGSRLGWERLVEYYKTSLGEENVIPEGGRGIPGKSVQAHDIKFKRTVQAQKPNQPDSKVTVARDAMPSWCGIFVNWSLITAGVPLPKWKLGSGPYSLKAAYPKLHAPKAGDVAYRNTNSHYGIVVKSEPESVSSLKELKGVRVTTINGNTAGANNLGGQIQEQTHNLESGWTAFFNPLYGVEDKMPAEPAPFVEEPAQPISEQGEPGGSVSDNRAAAAAPQSTSPKPTTDPSTKTGASPLKTQSVDAPAVEQQEQPVEDGASPEGGAPVDTQEVEIPRTPTDPAQDPDFQKVIADTKKGAKAQKSHGLPAEKAEAARLGAAAPSNEIESKAQAGQVDKMSEQPKGKFDKEGFKKTIRDKVEAAMPKNEDQAKDYKGNNKLGEVKDELKGDVAKEKEAAAGAIATTTTEAPDKSKVAAEPHTEMKGEEPGAKSTVRGPEKAAPKSKTDEEISMEKEATSLDDPMKDADVTEDQLQNSNEPTFTAALGTKKGAQESARKAPDDYRAAETPMVEQSKGDAQQGVVAQMADMHGARKGMFGKVDDGKNSAKGKNEDKRKAVSDQLNGIYTKAKTAVEDCLKKLETDVVSTFDEKIKKANEEFENDFARRSSAYYDGAWNSIRNWVAGVPKEVENIFHEEKGKFMLKMEAALDEVATMVETGLNEAMKTIADGRKEVDDAVKKLGPDLQDIGKEIAGQIAGKFDQLEQSVEDKQEQLAEMLSQKYVEQVQKMDAKLEQIKAEQKRLIGRAKDAIMAIIKTILELKQMLQDLLKKAASVIGDIIRNPGGFFDNLGTAIKTGLNNFVSNIWTHLKTAFFTWLMGVMPPGIQFPKEWDLKGIFSFIAQILGLTWANIRQRAVKKIGEPVVKALETTFDIFQIIVKDGIIGLWNYIKEKIGDLKTMIIDAIMDMIKSKVIDAGIQWIIGLLNPVGAFIKICMAIYNIVKFIIEKGKQIIEFVNSILDSVAEIVAGNIVPAAKRVEESLAKALPIAIGFLASLLGLGDLPQKVQAIIDRVRKPINAAIDWVLDKAIAFAKKLGVDKLVKKVKQGAKAAKDWAKEKVKKVKEKGKEVLGKILGFFGVKSSFKDEKGADHSVYYDKKGADTVLTVASTPRSIEDFLSFYETTYPKDAANPTKAKHLKNAYGLVKKMKTEIKNLEGAENEKSQKKFTTNLLSIKVDLAQTLGLLLTGNKKVGDTFESYKLEGLVGRKSSLPRATGDILEGDHQPQAALLYWAAKHLKPSKSEAWIGGGRANSAYAILLYKTRHEEGLTHHMGIDVSKEEAKINVEPDLTKRRKIVIGALKKALKSDADHMVKNVYNRPYSDPKIWDDIHSYSEVDLPLDDKKKLVAEIKANVKAGEESIKSQPLDDLIN